MAASSAVAASTPTGDIRKSTFLTESLVCASALFGKTF